MKTCPFCVESIQDAALVCRHCGREQPPVIVPTPLWRFLLVGGFTIFFVVVMWIYVVMPWARQAADGRP